jgi:hypothetical protein
MRFTIPDKDSPIWPIARVALLTITLGMCLYFNYQTFDPIKDPRAMLIMAILAGGFELTKRYVAPIV